MARMTEKQVEIHTFHSLCLSLIKKLKNIDLKVIDEQKFSFRKNEILKFSLYKNSHFRTIRPFNYSRYQKALKDNQMIDFDDILIYFLNISKKKLNFFDYILIDEFQDTNRLQYDVLKHLIHQKTAVFAVGDPDQAIYRFRGSCKAIIKRFIDEFRATLYTLKMNYRSHQRIIGLANTLILRQKSQYSKTLIPYHKGLGDVAYSAYQNEEIEAKGVINRLKSYLSKGVKPHHVAVIYRNHFRAQTFKYFLNSNDLRYTIDEKMDGYINCLTMHQSKGLEFDVVFIIGLEQGIIPSRRIFQIEGKYEERRLLFVAITRAKYALHMSRVTYSPQGYYMKPSCFVKDCGL
jgi:DNA helicase-2/ATP-dependent DNA helicase PcrA